jgi:SAM-dependent methyltransferase
MRRTRFDRFADEYEAAHARNIAVSGEEPAYFHEYKVRDLRSELHRRRQPARRILDFGTGVGNSLGHFRRLLPDSLLTGVDVSARSLAIARTRTDAPTALVAFDGRTLPFASGSFDAAFAACVFHHIDAPDQVPLLAELRRVLAPRGLLAVYEHNPLNPLTTHAVRTCEFDDDAVLIRAGVMRERVRAAGFGSVEVAYKIFFPRALAALRPLEPALGWLPVGAQYRATGRA